MEQEVIGNVVVKQVSKDGAIAVSYEYNYTSKLDKKFFVGILMEIIHRINNTQGSNEIQYEKKS